LQGRLTELEAKGLGLVAISYDPVNTLAAFSRQRGITFPLLSDAGSETIKRYGILNTLDRTGIPFPGTFIVDRKGRVTSRFFEESYTERNTVSSLLVRTGAHVAPVTATRVAGAHLGLTTYPSDPAIAPGNRFSLVLDIEPGPGIHIYAPGAKGYRPIALTIAEQPHIRVLPVQFPASQVYFFKPLNERVPVFQKPFTLAQEMVLEATQQAQAALRGRESLTVTGTLDYQACDAKHCFNPASIPLSWTVSLKPLVRERPNLKK
jgi:hypothetical protein